MKSLIKGIGITCILLLTILIISCIVAKTNRQHELETSLNSAIHQTMKVVRDKRYPILSNEELVAELNRNLLLQLNSNSKVEIVVYDLDCKQGFMDVEVVLTFNYPHGVKDTVSNRKTMIIDDIENKQD